MYNIVFTGDTTFQISDAFQQGSMYLTKDDTYKDAINDKLFDSVKIYDTSDSSTVREFEFIMCETLLLSDEQIEDGYKLKFQFYAPTEEQRAELALNAISNSLTGVSSDTTEIQEAIVDLYEMLLSMQK